ncbi:Sugar lactone lactonase YvrE [Pseudoxanthomonas sp. GM95]|uniref:L-dopachrome tautomerase-related protein n=1 Tax=Pseudoxanthomonas sp. GM95 TaxID=1881043 RepID=UPI0008C59B0B|nr:L-dopachrome tautomerase-related protein [Pseudoxanthomonas sp. GM95]SEM53120.1 Sugar lactone lactonase YvrE [Pseudoxanthomonas sp. GM95]
MKTSLLLSAGCALALCIPAAFADDASDPAATPAGSLEVVARFNGPGPSGIAVTPKGRVFVGFPRHAENHTGMTLGELVDGELVPFPSTAMSLPSQAPVAQWLVSVHGMTTDTRGNLWVIDDGKRAGIDGIPDGAAKVVGFDPDSGQVIASVALKAPALLQDSHMNDLRVDLTHGSKGTAYISDSSFGTSPALVVVDLASGRQRRVLAHHVSTQPQAGFVAILDGKPMRYDARHPTFPVGGTDAITLSPDSQTLYFAPLTSRALYSIPTSVLSDFDTSEATLASAVSDLGEKGFADGMASDAQGRLYITDGEHDAILRLWPDGHLDTVVRDPRIVWPDGIATTDKYVYVTLGQWDRLPGFNGGRDLRKPPYLLVRAPIDAPPSVDASKALNVKGGR